MSLVSVFLFVIVPCWFVETQLMFVCWPWTPAPCHGHLLVLTALCRPLKFYTQSHHLQTGCFTSVQKCVTFLLVVLAASPGAVLSTRNHTDTLAMALTEGGRGQVFTVRCVGC